MIDLLGEAKNYRELYDFALSCREKAEEGERNPAEYKQEWEQRFYLDFPKAGRNPEMLKRALHLVAGWSLFQEGRTLQETVPFLNKWYEAVMWLAAHGMEDKDRKKTEDYVNKQRKIHNSGEDWFRNLDKINYYRIACQAQENASLVNPPIIVPIRIMDAWENARTPEGERALHILYHYCGKTPGFTKTEITRLFCGNTNALKSKSLLSYLQVPGDEALFIILNVEKNFQWEDGEQGIEIPALPTVRAEQGKRKKRGLALQLSDENLKALRIRSNPDYWLYESGRVASAESMMKRYNKTRPTNLSAQNAATGSKAAHLKRCALALLYFTSEGKTPFPQRKWEDIVSDIPSGWMCPDWERIEQWLRENYASVLPLIEDFESPDAKNVGAFFQEQEEGKYSVRSNGISLQFSRKD